MTNEFDQIISVLLQSNPYISVGDAERAAYSILAMSPIRLTERKLALLSLNMQAIDGQPTSDNATLAQSALAVLLILLLVLVGLAHP